MNQIKHQKYGWNPPRPRQGIHQRLSLIAPNNLPPSVDLRSEMPPVYNQGQLGSCTANSISGLCEFLMIKEKINNFMPSRLFIYWNERFKENTVNTDSGASLDDGMNVVSTIGIPPETVWPYDANEFAVKPPELAFQDASKCKVISPVQVGQNLNDMKSTQAEGYPFVFGFTVYESFESQQVAVTGVVPMPTPNEQIVGGHAVCACGYYVQNNQTYMIVRNSWGSDWGQQGYFVMPDSYILNQGLANDFWTCHLIQENQS